MRSRNRLTIALTLVLLALGLAGTAMAQEAAEEDQVSLTGRISENSTGQLVLIDPESGTETWLRGAEEELAKHYGATVTVTGQWAETDDGEAYFAVSAVRAADA